MNIQQLLDDHHIPFKRAGDHRNVREGWIGLDCPQCGHRSEKFHLGINLENLYANCWKCGAVNLISVLSGLADKSYREIQHILGDQILHRRKTETSHTGRLRLPGGRCDLMPVHLRYLERRGLNGPLLARVWGLQGIGIDGWELAWRIFIPIHQKGEVVSWTTRSVGQRGASKYITAKFEDSSVPIKDVLFGVDYARNAIIICEGPFDVFKIGPGAVATLGTSYSNDQMYAISKFPVRAVCFDNEPAAQKRARKLCNKLASVAGRTENVVCKTGAILRRRIRWK